jgi:alginate O-acetyltransferase complex protein AlgI
MEIISLPFAIFSTAALGVYHILPRRGQNIWLLACSLYFAASWHWEYAAVLAVSILLNFFLGKRITSGNQSRNIWLILGISLNAAALILLRLAGTSFLDMLERTLSGGTQLSTEILIPVGFSFYTLQAISYLVDVSQRLIQPEEDLIDFGVYLAYFPRLLSGPIERARTFLPQLKNSRLVNNALLAEGGWLILVGLFRKLVLASLFFTLIPEGIFAKPLEFALSDRWIAILVYSLWLYNDFAGYTSLVRGISLFFGIRLSPNFKQPFFSQTTLEFWNRWHISLSFWLRDYIFFPIQRAFVRRGYSADNLLRVVIPPLITMTVSGLWHSATLSLVSWGLLHGTYQVIDHTASRNANYVPPKNRPRWQQILLSTRVYLLLLPTWMLFACPGLKGSVGYALSLFSTGGMLRIRPLELVAPACGLVLSFLLDVIIEMRREEYSLVSFQRTIQSAIIALGILCVILSMLWMNVPSAAFVYQGF